MKTFLFPGQGSQLRGMGAGLFEEFPDQTRQASEILGYSIRELCLEDPRKELNQTRFTQPALYVVSALSYFKRIQSGRDLPDMFAGHSLGEFNALMAAGAFDFELGLRLVKKRGELMGQVSDGSMAAIMNASSERIAQILREQEASAVDIAIYNSSAQSVIAGLKSDLAKVEPHFRVGDILYYPLNTSGAFHSRLMQPVGEQFKAYLASVKFQPLRKPVIANVSAQPYRDETLVSNLVDQISHPVLWQQSVEHLLTFDAMEFEEIGHGEVLTKLLKWIRQHAPRKSTPAVVARAEPMRDIAKERERSALDKVSAWNAAHPIGTRVRSTLIEGRELETRTEALVLFGHRAAVYLKGYNGYFDLDQIETEACC
jgi:malonyl CoA-acyl carrier protein transacylase